MVVLGDGLCICIYNKQCVKAGKKMLHDKEIKAVIGSYFTLQMVQYMMSIFSSGLAYNQNKVIPEVERNKNTSCWIIQITSK